MRGRGGAPARFLTTVFFTDMVGSTERAVELGDRRWRELLAAYHRIVRQALRTNHGRELDSAGDGFFAIFDQPNDAIACARDIADRLERVGISVRSGVHIGQVEVQGTKVSGIGVHIGARVAGLAGPGEILVSSTVRDALAGSDHAFVDRQTHALKGVPGEWRLFALVPAPRKFESEPAPVPTEQVPKHRRRALVLGLGAAATLVAGVVVAALMLRHGGAPQAPVIPAPNQVAEIAPDGQSFVSAIDVGGEQPVGVVDTGDFLWIINSRSQTLTRVDKSTLKAQSFGIGGAPTIGGIAYAAGSVWVTTEFGLSNGAPGSLLRFDATDGRQLPSITMSDGVAGIAADGQAVWVTNERTNAVVRLDTASGTVGDPIKVGRGPRAVAVTSTAVWVASALDRSVCRIDKRTGQVSPPIAVQGADAIAADDTSVWVAGTASNTVTRIDPATDGIVTTIQVSSGPVGLALTANDVWVADSVAGEVVRIDRSRGAIVGRLTARGHPSALSPEGGSVWVTVAG